MILDLLVLALRLAIEPLALIGFAGLGIVSKTPAQALKYAALWTLTVEIFGLGLERGGLAPGPIVAETALRLVGAVILTLGVFYLARRLRRRRPG